GGQYGDGTIFRVSRSGDFKVLVNFDATNGSDPYAGLIQANDGNFYGVTETGGSADNGVLFRLTPDGTLTVLHNFTRGNDGGNPVGGLVQASDGNLYGTTAAGGGDNDDGVFFSLDAGLPPFVSYLPTYGRPGALVQILGQGFTASSQVSFNGTLAASPDVVSPTYLRVVV